MDRRRFVQQYVERQRAYLPTYTAERLFDEHQAAPSKSLRCDEFGFDTPVLRPRVSANECQLMLQAGPSKPRAHGTEAGLTSQDPPPVSSGRVPLALKPRSKRKKASTPVDIDSERAARLADRRERKRKKRAIVNPPQKHDDEIVPTATPKKGRANARKARKPAALALLYGFSATNVTKDRLTLKSAPFLGVFSKGRASSKKKVSAKGSRKHPIIMAENAALKDSASRNLVFSEFAFLNKPSKRAADHSKIDDDSVSSISDRPIPQVIRATSRTRKHTESPALRTPEACQAAESEVWDIELQSNLPSSVHGVSSKPGGEDVVLDLLGWATRIDVTEAHTDDKTRSRSLSNLPPSIDPSQPSDRVASRSHDIILDSPDQDAVPDVCRVASPTPYDVGLLEFPSDDSPYHHCYARTNGTPEPDSVVETDHPCWDGCPSASPDGYAPFQGPLAQEIGELESAVAEYDCGQEHLSEQMFHMAETGRELAMYEDEAVCGSMCCSDEEPEDLADFLEGRALLLGVDEYEWPRCVELSGLAQAEMDVASRLRDHWLPLRL